MYKNATRHIFMKSSQLPVTYVEHLNVLNKISLECHRLIISLTILYNIIHRYISCEIISAFYCLTDNLHEHSKHVFVLFVSY